MSGSRTVSLDGVDDDLVADLDPNDTAFLRRVYDEGLDTYIERLRHLGFDGEGVVIDAGCGFGQWTLALAVLCDRVVGVDVAADRVRVAREVAAANDVGNVAFVRGDLESLPLRRGVADGVFSYSVVYYTRFEAVADEFFRVLGPGGTVYVCTNGPGKYLRDVVERPNPERDYDPRRYGLRTFRNTLLGRREDLSIDTGARVMFLGRAAATLEAAGFVDVRTGGEGTLSVRDGGSPTSFYRAQYLGLSNVFELLGEKPG